jgi:hypothetical protein
MMGKTIALTLAAWASIGAASTGHAVVQFPVHWQIDGNYDQGQLGYSVATAGDLNGDGYSDVIVGEPYADQIFNGPNNGRVRLYYGGASGVDDTPDWSSFGSPNSRLGWSLAPAGDVNGDGYDDFIGGAPFYDNGGGAEGAVRVYHGSPTGPILAWEKLGTQVDAHLGSSVSTAGDLNDDGYADVIVAAPDFTNTQTNQGRAYIYLGGPGGLAANPVRTLDGPGAGDRLGYAVAAAGDVNGDLYDDVLVSAPYHDSGLTNQGIVYCLHGSAGGIDGSPDWSELGVQAGESFGGALSMAGDVNGDGYTDVIVGSAYYDGGQTDEGRATVYLGGSSGLAASPIRTYESDQAEAHLGLSVGTAGDVNGDGYADVIVGIPYFDAGQTNEGQMRIYYGTPTGPAQLPAASIDSDEAETSLGASVQTAGDVNGDGASDIIVGAPLRGTDNAGRAQIYLGSADDYTETAAFVSEPNQVGANMGSGLGFADVNGDGYSDLLGSAWFYDAGETNEGRIYCWLGGRDGISNPADWYQDANQANGYFGRVCRSAGDVNGDGYEDAVATAPGWTIPEQSEGGVWVYHGSPTGLSAADWTTQGQQVFADCGWSAGAAGDVNGDGYGDLIVGVPGRANPQTDEGAAWLYLGSSTGLENTLEVGWEGNQDGAKAGYSVACAGDVNGDGYSDLISGAPSFDDGQTNEGCVFVFFGGTELSISYSQILTRNQAGAQFGIAVAPAGDVNADGYSDVVVGANRWSNAQNDEGSIAVYLGSPSGLATSPVFTYESNFADAFFGEWVSPAGDVNADGYADFVVGAPEYGANDEGLVYVFEGTASGVSAVPIVFMTGPGGRFGQAVLGGGDFDGDGFPDLAVGAPYFTNGQSEEGRVYLFYGNRHTTGDEGPGLDHVVRMRQRIDPAPLALLGKSDSQDSFEIWALGRTPFGRGRIRSAWEAQPLGETWTGAIARADWENTGPPSVGGSFARVAQVVEGLASDTVYHWRVRFEGESPFFPRSPWFSVAGNAPTEADLRTAGAPSATPDLQIGTGPVWLGGVVPNPVGGSAIIRLGLARADRVKLTLHDVSGRRIRTLLDGELGPGEHDLAWDGRGGNGARLVPGVYFARLAAVGHMVQARVVVIH